MRFIFIEFIECSFVVTAPCCCRCFCNIYMCESIIPNDDEKEAGVGDVLLQSLVLRLFAFEVHRKKRTQTQT